MLYYLLRSFAFQLGGFRLPFVVLGGLMLLTVPANYFLLPEKDGKTLDIEYLIIITERDGKTLDIEYLITEIVRHLTLNF